MRTWYLAVGSLAAHIAGLVAVSHRAEAIKRHQTLIAVVTEKKKAEEKKPPKPVEAPKEELKRQQRIASQTAIPPPVPVDTPRPSNAAPSEAMAAMPDFGLNLSGVGAGSGPGIGVPQGQPGGVPGGASSAKREKVLAPAGAAPKAATVDPDLAAEIAAWKLTPLVRVKPVYPDEARASEIEGTVTVEVRVDCTGKVINAQIVKSLGAAFDANVLTAVRKTEFEPAPRCAKGFEKSVKVNYAFRLGD